MSDLKKPDQPPAEGTTFAAPDAAVTEDQRTCDVAAPDHPDVRCTLHAGHGRVRPAGQVTWYDHANPMRGAWWNVARTAGEWAELAKLVPDISIPRQDGQPFGEGHTVSVDADGVVVAALSREGVINLAEVAVNESAQVGDVDLDGTVRYIGPECFASLDGQVINWRGRSYVPRPEPGPGPESHLESVTSETWYGVFNDPDALAEGFASGQIHENLRVTLLETPLFESRSLPDVLRHAQLTWEDRQAQHAEKIRIRGAQRSAYQVLPGGGVGVSLSPEPVPPPTPVIIKTRVITESEWTIVETGALRAAVAGPPAREVPI